MKNELLKIQGMIHEIRGYKAMIDSDLAVLYGVEVRTLNQAVKRNISRFPTDFMFQLTADEWKNLRSQFVIFKNDTRKFKPYVFTEHGILMLSSVLNSEQSHRTTQTNQTYRLLYRINTMCKSLPCAGRKDF